MANIKDVAKKAGVSISTVSYAINNNPKVSESTRKRIKLIAEEMNFNPSGIARYLKKKKSMMIGLFVEGILGPYYSSIITGIQRVMPKEYNLIIATVDHGRESSAYTLLKDRWVDGAIIVNSTQLSENFILQSSEKMPLVLMDREAGFNINQETRHDICNIVINNENGAREVVRHLISSGRKKIAYLSGSEDSYDNQKRHEGYVQTMMENGLQSNIQVIPCNFHYKLAHEVMVNYLKENEAPEAIFAANDEMAMAAIDVFRDSGISVPGRVAVAGFDDVDYASRIQPSLTTVNYDKIAMGKIALEKVLLMINQKSVENVVMMDTKLIVRDSSGLKD